MSTWGSGVVVKVLGEITVPTGGRGAHLEWRPQVAWEGGCWWMLSSLGSVLEVTIRAIDFVTLHSCDHLGRDSLLKHIL